MILKRSNYLRAAWVAIVALALTLVVAPPDLAGAAAGPEAVQPISAPAVVLEGQGDWLWVLWLGAGGEGDEQDQARPTLLTVKQTNKPWRAVQQKNLPRLLAAAARDEQLDVFLPATDGRPGAHFAYRSLSPDEPASGSLSQSLDPLPAGFELIALAAQEQTLYALGWTADGPTTAAASRPDSAPAQSRPESRRLQLLAQEFGPWRPLPPPPAAAGATAMSLAVHRGHPTLVWAGPDELAVAELIGQGEAKGWRTRQIERPQRMARLAELRAFSVNQRLHLIAWPAEGDQPAFLGRIDQGRLEVEPLPEQAAGTLAQRHRSWDVAVSDRQLVFVRQQPGQGGGLELRRYDPQSRQFVDDWQPIEVLTAQRHWIQELGDSRLMTIALIAALAILFLFRRPSAVIRLPIQFEPARLLPRTAAFLIDLLPCSALAFAIIYGGDVAAYDSHVRGLLNGQGQDVRMMIFSLLGLGIYVGYQILAEAIFSTTLGKRLFGLSVFSITGQRPGLGQVIIRNGLKIIEMPVWPFVALMVVIHPAHQALGDMLAGAVVVGPRRRQQDQWMIRPGEQAERRQPAEPSDLDAGPGDRGDDPDQSPGEDRARLKDDER